MIYKLLLLNLLVTTTVITYQNNRKLTSTLIVFLNVWTCCTDRTKDLEMFLEHTRAKFVGFQVKHDKESLAGLPQPIHEGVKVLKQVQYQYHLSSETFHNRTFLASVFVSTFKIQMALLKSKAIFICHKILDLSIQYLSNSWVSDTY